jgi:predicted small secreted protein
MRILVIAGLGLMAAACNTVQGFGRDLQAVGDALTSASDEAMGDSRSGEELAGGPRR